MTKISIGGFSLCERFPELKPLFFVADGITIEEVYYLPEFNDGCIQWTIEEFDQILEENGFSTDKNDTNIMIANGLHFSEYDRCYWKEERQ